MADERKAYRDRIDSLLDELSKVTADRDALKMRAELAEEAASYAEYQLTECRESKG